MIYKQRTICFSIFFSLSIIFSWGSSVLPADAQDFDFGACTDVDPSDANSISTCLTSGISEKFDSCTNAANAVASAMLYNRIPVSNRPTGLGARWFTADEITAEVSRFRCQPLAEAYRLFTEQTVPWSQCSPNGSEGSANHMASCIRQFNATARLDRQIQLRNLDSCITLHTTYDRLVLDGVNRLEYIPFRPDLGRSGAQPDNGQVLDFQGAIHPFQWIGGYGFTGRTFTDRFNTGPYIRLNSSPFPYDCSIAADAREELVGVRPDWAACIGFNADQVVDHFAQCVPTGTRERMSCVEGRELYESLLTTANAGRRPEGYQPLSCDTVAAGFDRINEIQLAVTQSAAEEAQRRAADIPAQGRTQSSGGSGIFMLLLILIVGGGVAWFYMRRDKGSKEESPATEKEEFESGDDDRHMIVEENDITVISWKMHQYNMMSRKEFGRFIEIKPDRITLSAPYSLKKGEGQRKFTKALYNSGTWRKSAKVYASDKVKGLRLRQDQPDTKNLQAYRDSSSWKLHIVVLDYGKTSVDLNYVFEAGRNNEIGNLSASDEGIIQLHATILDAMKQRFGSGTSSDPKKSEDDDLDISVTFDGVSEEESERMKKEVQARVERMSRSKNIDKKSSSDDPF